MLCLWPLGVLASAAVYIFQGVVADPGLPFNPDDPGSVKAAAKVAAEGMLKYYHGNEPGHEVGLIDPPYYWWIGGAMFQALIDYWHYTGDTAYNDMTIKGIMAQTGTGDDFKPVSQAHDLGNDDQAFWALAAMSAAETKFPNPPAKNPQWLELVQAVFNEQVADWYKRKDTCNGGLMWQIFEYNNGFGYKNTISNGCFFNMGARLAAYTGNQTYADWAEKAFNWVRDIGLITPDWQFLDGTYTSNHQNCTKTNPLRWTYNAGIFLHGAANMYRFTNGSDLWKERTMNISTGLKNLFFTNKGIMSEVSCEPVKTCNNDQQTFKAHTARWMAASIKIAPFLEEQLMPLLRSSSIAAAQQCSGPNNDCGLDWTQEGNYDGIAGPGVQMSAMQIFLSNLVHVAEPPANSATGISKGNPAAGTASDKPEIKPPSIITAKDRAGATVLTVIVAALIVLATLWVIIGGN